jgi:hypothetical protein
MRGRGREPDSDFERGLLGLRKFVIQKFLENKNLFLLAPSGMRLEVGTCCAPSLYGDSIYGTKRLAYTGITYTGLNEETK